MSAPTVIPPGEGEIVGDSPDRRVEILCDHEELNATWSRFAAGRDGASPHIHHHHTDLFYVLTGELTVRLGAEDDHVRVAAGNLVRAPAFVIHGFRNDGDAEVTYLNLHAPGMRFNDFMRAIRDDREFDWDQHEPPAEGVRPASDAAIGEVVRVEEHEGATETVLADEERIRVSRLELEAGAPAPAGESARLRCLYVLGGELEAEDHGHEVGTWIHAVPGAELAANAAKRTVRALLIETPAASG